MLQIIALFSVGVILAVLMGVMIYIAAIKALLMSIFR